jgi:hypothetical protein
MRSLDQMIEVMHTHARGMLIGSATEQLTPLFHVQFKNRPDALIPAPWRNDQEKLGYTHAVKAVLRQFKPIVVNYAFLSEAWVATQDHEPRPDDLSPSQRETRKECVIVSAGDHDGARMKMWEIIRDDQARVTDLAEIKSKAAAHFEGRMHNLLAED